MATLGAESRKQRDTCHPKLIRIIDESIKLADFVVLEGFRDEAHQNADFAKGVSKLKWPNGRHNKSPSRAFDFSPFPVDWSNKVTALARFLFIGGVMWAVAVRLGIKIRFGWDWNGNFDPRDESFLDWGHVELDPSEE